MCCINKIDKIMKRLICAVSAAMLLVQGCSKTDSGYSDDRVDTSVQGRMSVALTYEYPVGKSLGDYDFVLSEESLVTDIQVLVFDGVTGALQRSSVLSSIESTCEFQIPAGLKTVYALINGPDVGKVKSISELLALTDNLSLRDYRQSGFVMMGCADCEVVTGAVARPLIEVGRLVSRVVLRSITCNIARQYEKMTVDCVYLGHAAMEYCLGGMVMDWADADQCPDYFYRSIGCELQVGQLYDQPVCLYCYPNDTLDYTFLYLSTTIGEKKYYYRIPLDKGLSSNVSCAVDVAITNLGADSPVDGDIQKGEIKADIFIEGWAAGYLYDAEF